MTDLHPAPAPIVLDASGADIPAEATGLRDRGPLVPVVLPGGIRAWAVTDPNVIKELFVDWRVSKDAHRHWPTFIAGEVPADWPLISWVSVRNMFTAYGKDHQRLRKLVGPAFTARRIAALRPQITKITTDLLADLTMQTGVVVDLREEYAAQVPLRVITALMGVPADLRPRLRVCVDELFSTVPRRHPQDTFTEMVDILATLVARRRTEPGEDMTSLLINHRDEDTDRLSEEELLHTLLLVISAGYETTVNLIDQAVYQLLTRPGRLAQLRAGAFTWSALVEETLRYAPPVPNLPLRYAVTDIDIADRRIKAGDAILACFAAANRDPYLHEPDPDEFDPTRRTKEHLSFGYGPHFCLGAPLARLEAAIALPALFNRFPDMTLATSSEGLETLDSFVSHGHQHLPVRLTGPTDADTAESGR